MEKNIRNSPDRYQAYPWPRTFATRLQCKRCIDKHRDVSRTTIIASRQLPDMLSTVRTTAWLVGTYASWSLRWYTYVFLRRLPFSDRYLGKIGTLLALYLGSAIILSRLPLRRASWTSLALNLASGSYDLSTRLISRFNFLVNLICFLSCLDFVYRIHYLYDEDSVTFCRTGHVTSESVKLLCRASYPGSLSLSICSPSGSCHELSAPVGYERDLTSFFKSSDLWPDTMYTYSASNGHQGKFKTRRRPSDMQHFSLFSSSCMKPNWPYSPFNHPLRIQGLEHLASYASNKMPEMMLFLGDFIYSDLPAQLSPYTTKYYSKLYRQIYASPSWTQALRDVPWLHMFDDHEIVNDYAPSALDMDLYDEAIQPFVNYQMFANPDGIGQSRTTYFTFNIGWVSFFVLDNRSYRSRQPIRSHGNSSAGWGNRTMLGATQMHDLRTWVKQEGQKGKGLLVVVSGVPFTRNWSEGGDEFDSWAGYLSERDEILSLLWDQGGGMVISGDRHEHATTLLPPPNDSKWPKAHAVIEFSTSPLSFFHQPWKREYKPHLPTDIPIYQEWEGMSRFGVFDFDVTPQRAKVNFTLVVDGLEDWSMLWQKGGPIV